MIRKISKRIRKSGESGIFHDARADIRTLIMFINDIADKVDEIIDVINTQEENK